MTAGQCLRERFLSGEKIPVIDAHGHMGPFHGIYLPEASLEAMIHGMDDAGIESIALSPHSALHGDTREGNDDMLAAVAAHPGRVYGYCTLNPGVPSEIEREMDRCLGVPGVVGIKIHPASHETHVMDDTYRPVWERANAEQRLVLSHTWASGGGCGARDMRRVAEAYPDVRLLLGHSCYGAWEEAIALAAGFPNVYLELTAAAHVHGLIEWMVRDAGADKVVYGTDYPWFDHAAYIGWVVFSRIAEDDMQCILYGNAKRLIGAQAARWV